MRKIALFGGSFNPPHQGHFMAAEAVYRALGVDEIWFLFSQNRFKDPNIYASFEMRMKMGEILKKNHPNLPIMMSDFEEKVGTHITADILERLQAAYPEDRFIWVMGADNLTQFERWERYDYIIENFPIAVLQRAPYNEDASRSFVALTYEHLKIENPRNIINERCGWGIINLDISFSSSKIIEELRQGKRDFGVYHQEMVDYILQEGLYGLSLESIPTAPESKPPTRNFE